MQPPRSVARPRAMIGKKRRNGCDIQVAPVAVNLTTEEGLICGEFTVRSAPI